MFYDREKGIWKGMMQRCYNPKAASYPNYGGRGIRVCERWHDYKNFYVDMGPSNGLTIERMNNDYDYHPMNCKWATFSEQASNKRPAKKVKPVTHWELSKYPNLGNKSAYTYR